MLYRTHPSFFFSFNPFTTSSIPPPHPTTTTTPPPHLLSPPPPPPPPIQVEQGMECLEGAMKGCFSPETAAKRTQQQALLDDLWAVSGQSGVSGDEFLVDDFLDFSKGGIEDGFFEAEDEPDHEEETKACSLSVSPQEKEQEAEKDKDSDPGRSSFSAIDDFGSVPCSELSVPADDLEGLEWLSHFVDDSFSEYSLAGKLPDNPTDNRSEPPEIPAATKPCFTTPVQTKARSKRARTGGRVWSLGSRSLTESSSSTSSSSSSTSSSSPSNAWLIYTSPGQTAESLLGQPPPPAKKQKKRKQETAGAAGPQQPRRCSHCLVQKTPQWRAGPLGAKTLCNACGVRYKSGRLLPEYRPACSPTFSSEVHSNNHRKVLEMRRKKEVEGGLGPPVQSF